LDKRGDNLDNGGVGDKKFDHEEMMNSVTEHLPEDDTRFTQYAAESNGEDLNCRR